MPSPGSKSADHPDHKARLAQLRTAKRWDHTWVEAGELWTIFCRSSVSSADLGEIKDQFDLLNKAIQKAQSTGAYVQVSGRPGIGANKNQLVVSAGIRTDPMDMPKVAWALQAMGFRRK